MAGIEKRALLVRALLASLACACLACVPCLCVPRLCVHPSSARRGVLGCVGERFASGARERSARIAAHAF
eukprot:354921-Chlamydomonas_euryale.AAC.2